MGPLAHSPADILATLLVRLGLGGAVGEAWPVYVSSEPASPDNVLTVYDTAGRSFDSSMVTGRRWALHGFQVRVRSATPAPGYVKACAVAVALDEQINAAGVTLEGVTYCVADVDRTTDVIPLGKEPESKRSLFTVNGLALLRML